MRLPSAPQFLSSQCINRIMVSKALYHYVSISNPFVDAQVVCSACPAILLIPDPDPFSVAETNRGRQQLIGRRDRQEIKEG